MTSREVVERTIKFQTPDRLAISFSPEYGGTDFAWAGMNPTPDAFLNKGVDEWGCVWDNIGYHHMGQVVDYPLKTWDDFKNLTIPDIMKESRWEHLENIRELAGDKFLLCGGMSLFERVKFLRGVENGWTDPILYPDELEQLLDVLTDMQIKAVEKFSEFGMDGYFMLDDWGVQNSLILSPELFRKFWKPRYEKIFKAVHEKGALTFLHSCGNIVEILDDFIEIGLDVINQYQQENMGLELLGKRFGGRITFLASADIQTVLCFGSDDDIRKYCREMVKHLWRPEGGFIPMVYGDNEGMHIRPDAIKVMCEEFLKINDEIYK